MGETIDKVKEKVGEAKDSVVDSTKDLETKAKETIDKSSSSSSSGTEERKYEEGIAGTNTERKSDPLTQYSDKEAMTPAKVADHEPTAVKRDPSDQEITSPGQTGTDTESAKEEYRKRGMTKV